MTKPTQFPARLKAWRARHGLSQPAAIQRLAEFQISLSALRAWEQGVNQPSRAVQVVLGEVLKS